MTIDTVTVSARDIAAALEQHRAMQAAAKADDERLGRAIRLLLASLPAKVQWREPTVTLEVYGNRRSTKVRVFLSPDGGILRTGDTIVEACDLARGALLSAGAVP